ncbi:adhesion G protein-coupled receptor A3 [Heterodontus francisci]|uniref:adhesion G protein-coupled receptor A3 n=1 Tax=Heterodontus francisci TaxID=7792 RepID=UPI00355BA098
MKSHIAGVCVELSGVVLLLVVGGCISVPSGCKRLDERPKNAGKVSSSSPAATPVPRTADRKVVCTNLELTEVFPPDTLPNRTVTLILSSNKLTELKNHSFVGQIYLERLDMRNNLIGNIESGAFWGLSALKRLDLSNNRIGCLNGEMFRSLANLVRLNLSGNLFATLSQGPFENLLSLKYIEFQTDYLLCDCNLLWMIQWIKTKNITVRETKCAFPKSLHGQLVTSVKKELLTCDAPLELPSFQLTPSHRQVVFEGDSLPFQCMASYIDQDMQVLWYQDGKIVETDESQEIFVEKNMIHNCSFIVSTLTISNIQMGSTGNWECHVQTKRGNNTKQVNVVVLESTAKYCPPEIVMNNKGDFRWPRTLAGITAYLMCTRYSAGTGIYPGGSQDEKKAWRKCDRGGFWSDDDYSRCQYANDVTRVLYMFNQMPLNLTNAVATARQLLAYTVEAANFSDKMDVIFVAEMIEKFGRFAEKYRELGDVMVDIASNIMLADEHVLWMAQWEAKACTRIVQCLQRIATYRLASGAQVYSTYSPNIAMEASVVKANSFTGMTCTVFQKVAMADRTGLADFGRRDPDGNLDKQFSFKCSPGNISNTLSSFVIKNTVAEASVQLPPSLFANNPVPTQMEDAVYKLQLIAFRNGKLFPSTGNSTNLADDGKRRSVASPVIYTKIDGNSLYSLSQPITVTLRRIAHGVDAVAAYWDFNLLNGYGGWISDGCQIVTSDENVTTMQCYSLNNYAVLMDLTGADFLLQFVDLLHPVVYVAAAVLLTSLVIIIASYIYYHSAVRISRKSWHMLVNFCFHVFLTCAVFVGGINQTRNISVCQAVGIILHYSTLATILWVGVTARNIFKQLTRKSKRCQDPEEPPPPPRPMLRFYLIGGGIPIIVCGITAAANIKNYGSKVNAPYCWMAWEPSLGAFYGPVGFIIFVNCIYFLSIFVQLKQHPERKYELKEAAEEHQRLASTDHGESHVNDSASTSQANCSVVSSSALENEHTFQAQLLGACLSLFMYIALWVSGALAVSQYYPMDLIFSCLFGATALSLAAFLILHHCIGREDVRLCWTTTCCPGRSTYSMQVNVQPTDSSHANRETPKLSNSSAESSCTNKTASSNNKLFPGCKLTNLHAAAVQNQVVPLASNISTQLDNSLTEHSMDNELKMHVAPVEVPYRSNGQVNRHHKNRTRVHQAHRHSRLTVLREYAYDVPTSVEGSVHNSQPRSRHSNHESHHGSRRSRSGFREHHQSQSQPDNSDVSYTLTQCNQNVVKDGVNSSKDSLQQPIVVELENNKSYGLNLASQNGLLKGSGLDVPLLNADSTGNIRTGFWRNETTV